MLIFNARPICLKEAHFTSRTEILGINSTYIIKRTLFDDVGSVIDFSLDNLTQSTLNDRQITKSMYARS